MTWQGTAKLEFCAGSNWAWSFLQRVEFVVFNFINIESFDDRQLPRSFDESTER
jgi:hypothetical protein